MATNVKESACNPKQVQNTGIGTKSQQALKLHQEPLKTGHKIVRRKQWEAENQQQFELKQQKKKEKHRASKSFELS